MNNSVDINALMREGHVHLRDAEVIFLQMLEARTREVGRPARIFELGCASGLLTAYMAERFAEAEIVANEEFPELAELARSRLAGTRVTLYTGPISAWERPADIIVSGGADVARRGRAI